MLWICYAIIMLQECTYAFSSITEILTLCCSLPVDQLNMDTE
jgi:hypothetical protein